MTAVSTQLETRKIEARAAGLQTLKARIVGRFARAEPRRRVLAYLRGLLGNVGRKNGSSAVKGPR